MTHQYKIPPQDKQAPMTGKSENDFNKQGTEKPTQKNQGKRTAHSRHDRESQVGGSNQSQARKGGPNSSGAPPFKR